jgi:methylated-DNA-[protein]-cysteine S-methyltransferase
VLIVAKARGEKIVFKRASLNDLCQAIYILVQLIPQGFVTSYSSIAKLLNIHPRIVAQCLAKNQDIIIIPCHRVIHRDMRIGGYRVLGKEFKKKLLALEGVQVKDDHVSKEHFIELSELIKALD